MRFRICRKAAHAAATYSALNPIPSPEVFTIAFLIPVAAGSCAVRRARGTSVANRARQATTVSAMRMDVMATVLRSQGRPPARAEAKRHASPTLARGRPDMVAATVPNSHCQLRKWSGTHTNAMSPRPSSANAAPNSPSHCQAAAADARTVVLFDAASSGMSIGEAAVRTAGP